MAFMPVVSLSSGPYVIVNVELSCGICYFGSFIKLLTNAANRPLFHKRGVDFLLTETGIIPPADLLDLWTGL